MHHDLEKCLSKQYYEVMSKGGVIRTAPAVTRQLGRGFYGIGCPHLGVECFVAQIAKLLMHYGCTSSVGTKLHVSLRQLIVELGLSEQPLQQSFSRFNKHVARCWLVSFGKSVRFMGYKLSSMAHHWNSHGSGTNG